MASPRHATAAGTKVQVDFEQVLPVYGYWMQLVETMVNPVNGHAVAEDTADQADELEAAAVGDNNSSHMEVATKAKQELEKLRKESLPSKAFYTRLVDIFRLYISRRKGIASLQKTTDDLVVQLRSLKLPGDEFNRLAQSLRMSDFVKFAKFEPADNDKIDSFKTIKDLIDGIEKTEVEAEKQNQS